MTGTVNSIDAARIELLLHELRLPGVKAIWPKLAAQSDKEGWPAARFLAALVEHEACWPQPASDRAPHGGGSPARWQDTRYVRLRHCADGLQSSGMALASGDVWLKTGAILLLFGPPGGGKSHLSGSTWPRARWRVLFARTTDLVQRLQVARRELALEAAIAKQSL